ncbi:hypothetical protein [Acetanaerobacterium elongatum]|uniref:DUF2178 domain-containing protein n=1 Tax=Acetanaerobacterium elongatum TaxID=258515 RepID=A0A1G9XQ01_9FIRM|nr:hypothetical protein [Acetanaerobacterium elongatum]SDM98601.1 hypothetical protein SAMN05192585_1093 [Acetanaerobacterium elongatum]
MEQFKKLLRTRIAVNLFGGLFILACVIIGAVTVWPAATNFSSFHLGFQVGLTTVVEFFLIWGSIKYLRVLGKEAELKKLYYEENDERTRAINEKTGGNVLNACSLIILTAGILAGYFNAVVFFTLVACCVFLSVTHKILYIYYSKKL